MLSIYNEWMSRRRGCDEGRISHSQILFGRTMDCETHYAFGGSESLSEPETSL